MTTPSARNYLRSVISQAERAALEIDNTRNMMLNPLIESEEIYKLIGTVEDCEKRMHEICGAMAQIYEELKRLELPVLYAPPSFFNKEE